MLSVPLVHRHRAPDPSIVDSTRWCLVGSDRHRLARKVQVLISRCKDRPDRPQEKILTTEVFAVRERAWILTE
jgi:hypothetical protein